MTPPPTGSAAVNSSLASAYQRFVAGFPSWYRKLDQAIDRLASGADAEVLPTLTDGTHRMAGLAGMIGFPTVSAQASALETIILEDDSLQVDRMRSALRAIREAFTGDLASPPSWAESLEQQSGGACIVLAEDDDEQRTLYRVVLRGAGYDVVALPSGNDVVATVRERRPAAVLLDVNLPGADGYEICRTLKSDAELAKIPVAFLTTRSRLDDRLAGLTLGADEYLTKPIDLDELLLRLRVLVARTRESRDTAQPMPYVALPYEDFVTRAATQLSETSASLALIRVAPHQLDGAIVTIRDEVRRRDLIGQYDRSHALLLMPTLPLVETSERVQAIVRLLASNGVDKVHAGVAATLAPGQTPIETLVGQADEALAEARVMGVPVVHEVGTHRSQSLESRATIVLAEDDPEVARIVEPHLRSAGYHTVLAFDGQEAIDAVKTHQPAVLVLDLMMPKMTGFEVLTHLKQLPDSRPHVVVLSARGREDDVTRAFDEGADDYMTKPFNPQELLARVARLLR